MNNTRVVKNKTHKLYEKPYFLPQVTIHTYLVIVETLLVLYNDNFDHKFSGFLNDSRMYDTLLY